MATARSLSTSKRKTAIPSWIWFQVLFSISGPSDTVLKQVRQITRGLEYLHRQSVIHGDLRGVSSPILHHSECYNLFWTVERIDRYRRTSSHLRLRTGDYH